MRYSLTPYARPGQRSTLRHALGAVVLIWRLRGLSNNPGGGHSATRWGPVTVDTSESLSKLRRCWTMLPPKTAAYAPSAVHRRMYERYGPLR